MLLKCSIEALSSTTENDNKIGSTELDCNVALKFVSLELLESTNLLIRITYLGSVHILLAIS